MALPSCDNLKTLDYVYNGGPYCSISAKSGIDLESMDYAFEAKPFVRNSVSIVIYNQEETDSFGLSDTIEISIPGRTFVDSDSLSLTDSIVCIVPKTSVNTDTFVLTDDIENMLISSIDMVQDFRTVKLSLNNADNKINTAYRVLSNVSNFISSAVGQLYNLTQKINSIAISKNDAENDFRMIQEWMRPGNAGFQSKGKEYIRVYIASTEVTDVDVDSINISKIINGASTASFTLARAYDSTRPTIESIVEIYYDSWKLYRGYITEIAPTDRSEKIEINCSDEFWKQNQSKVYFQVGHKPTDNTELYYNTISTALTTGCGYNLGVGNFIPQTMSCFGAGKSEAMLQLVQNSGNNNLYFDESGAPIVSYSGAGDIIWIERQSIGTNLGLYQVLSHSFRETVLDLVNQFRVQMGEKVVRRFGANGSLKKYSGYEYVTTTEWATPDWDISKEILAKNSGTGYGWDYHQSSEDADYSKVFKAHKLPNLNKDLEDWTDRYEPEVHIYIPFGDWECNVPSGKMTEGFSIDYQNQTLTFNEPIYLCQKDANGEVVSYRRPEVKLWLWKKKYYSNTNDPADHPNEDISNPLMFFTSKLGTYPTTIQGLLSLSGLSIQQGGYQHNNDGTKTLIPSWNDTAFATDYANWQLSKVCDKKVNGDIELTLDATCFYNLSLNKRIMIDGILDDSLNIVGLNYNMSNFTVSVQLESGRYFQRSVNMQSHGE